MNKAEYELVWSKNTKDFAYRFRETEEGLWVEVWHRHGEMISQTLIPF